MANMFTSYDTERKTMPCSILPPPPNGIKVLKNVKGDTLGVQVDYSTPLQLYFHLEGVCGSDLEELSSGVTKFEILTTTHKKVFSKEYLTAEILNQETGDLFISLTTDEMTTFKKETYTMRVTLTTAINSYEVFAEKDGYLVIR